MRDIQKRGFLRGFGRHTLIYSFSLAIHFLILLLLLLLPIRIGPADHLGLGRSFKANLLLTEEGQGHPVIPEKLEERREDLEELLDPEEKISETESWSLETLESKAPEKPMPDILGTGGSESPRAFKRPSFPSQMGFENFKGSFNDYISLLRRVGLDVVLVLDSTGSMKWIITETKRKMARLIRVIKRLVPIARVGIVAYRDKGEDFLTRKHPLTINIGRLQKFLDQLEAEGGGDPPEAVEEGLRVAIEEMRWRKKAKKVIILVGDAPPHEADLPRALHLVRKFRSMGGFVSAIDTTHEANDESFSRYDDSYVLSEFVKIAQEGHGEATSLAKGGRIIKQLVILTFGTRWKDRLQGYLRYYLGGEV